MAVNVSWSGLLWVSQAWVCLALLSGRSILTSLLGAGAGTLWWAVGVHTPRLISTDATGYRRRARGHPVWVKAPGPHPAFSDTIPVGSWSTLLAIKSRCLPTLPAVSMELGPQPFLWCLVWTKQLLSESFLSCYAAPFPVLCRKQSFLGIFFVLCTWLISDCQLLQYPVWGIWGQRLNPGNSPPCHSWGSQVPNQSASPLCQSRSYIGFIDKF